MDELENAIAEATAAFDAGNHAFGRFVTYVVRPHNEPVPAAVQAVRERFQEAAISVPPEPSLDDAHAFLVALRQARESLQRFLSAPSPGYALEEAMAAPGALDEAIEVLERALESPTA